MSNIDVNTLREGDVVSVRGTVTAIGGVWSFVKFADQPHSLSVRNDDIVSVEPRPLAVGDWVKSEFDTAMDGVIRYIEGNEAVVYERTGGLEVWLLSGLQRA